MLSIDSVTIRFGGVTALDEFSATVADGESAASSVQTVPVRRLSSYGHPHRPAQQRSHHFRRQGAACGTAVPSGLPRHRPDVPEPCPLPFPERARQHDSRCPLPGAGELRRGDLLLPAPFAATGGLQPRPTTSSRHLTSRMSLSTSRGTALRTLKRVELARALAARPKLLLPMNRPGPHHGEVHELGELIKRIRDEFHLSALLVEHHMGLVMEFRPRRRHGQRAEDRDGSPRGPRRPSGGRCVPGRAT